MTALKSFPATEDLTRSRSRWAGWTPIRDLTPERLQGAFDQWRAGYLAPLARIFSELSERGDITIAVIAKRKAALASCKWEVLQIDDSPEAARHAEVLRYAYENVTTRDALDLDEEGDLENFFQQAADALGSKYAVHEIIWRELPGGYSAEFRSVPLWFFERTEGRLTYQPEGLPRPGLPLEAGEWIRTVNRYPLLKANSIAYLYKAFALRDWLQYCERNGMPAFIGHTSAAPDSAEWRDAEEAIGSLAAEFAAVVSESTRLEKLDLGSSNAIPYPALIDRCDRAIARIWRGGDLSTLSNQNSVGANGQADQGDALCRRDADLIAATLNTQFGRPLIQATFGFNVIPKAYLSIVPPSRDRTERANAAFDSAQRLGVNLSLRQVRQKLSLATPADAADTLFLRPPPAL